MSGLKIPILFVLWSKISYFLKIFPFPVKIAVKYTHITLATQYLDTHDTYI